MTITAPLVTESDIAQPAIEEITIDLTTPEVEIDESLLRDPLLPFLITGSLSLIGLVIAAFLLSSGALTL